jgi:Xaa-Pro dipeptidase
MEYSPRNAIPYISKVDAGTVDLVRSFGIEVVSSADLLQVFTSEWSEDQFHLHLEAAEVLDDTVSKAWDLIAYSLASNRPISEYDVQQFILTEFSQQNCLCEDPPICAVNAHSADPHYTPNAHNSTPIKPNDFILIDLWCKKKAPRAVYADITRVGVAAAQATAKQQHIFEIVRDARDAAMEFIESRLKQGIPVRGWEVDHVCRMMIQTAGYGEFFTHRTGHNIGEKDHGDGANIDNFETKDTRLLLPKTCFSIEPGIYLPEEFGVRLEHDVYIEADGRSVKVTGGLPTEIFCLK